MNDLFDGVVYAGIDTDKHKYPIGKLNSQLSSFSLTLPNMRKREL